MPRCLQRVRSQRRGSGESNDGGRFVPIQQAPWKQTNVMDVDSTQVVARLCFNRPMGELAEHWAGQPEPQLATIGDISISQHWVVTPSGPHPIRGSVWTVTDMSHYEERISTAGIVLAILFVWFCLLGLLFLLMKDRRMVGYVQVTVQGRDFYHSTMIPATSPQAVMGVHQMVNYARAVAAAA